MTYLTIRDLAVAQIREGMQKLFPKITVEPHSGMFNEATIRRDMQRAPAVLTSLVKTTEGVYGNSVAFVSWVLCRASNEDRLYDGALKMVSVLTAVIRDADFPLAIKNTAIESECLYSGSLDAINATLWAVKWELVLGERAFIHAAPEDMELDEMDGADITDTVELA